MPKAPDCEAHDRQALEVGVRIRGNSDGGQPTLLGFVLPGWQWALLWSPVGWEHGVQFWTSIRGVGGGVSRSGGIFFFPYLNCPFTWG